MSYRTITKKHYIFVLQRSRIVRVMKGLELWGEDASSVHGLWLEPRPEEPMPGQPAAFDLNLVDPSLIKKAQWAWQNALDKPNKVLWGHEWFEHGRYDKLTQNDWMELVLECYDNIAEKVDTTLKNHITEVDGYRRLHVGSFLKELQDSHNLYPTIHSWPREKTIGGVKVKWQELYEIRLYLDANDTKSTIPPMANQGYTLDTPMHVS